MSLQDLNETAGISFNSKLSKMLNVETVIEMNDSQYVPGVSTTNNHNRYLYPKDPLPLIETKQSDINELFNILFGIINRNKYFKARLLGVKRSNRAG
jgi:hypothetical protein